MKKFKLTSKASNTLIYLLLATMAVIWVIPIIWVVLTSFRAEMGAFSPHFIPEQFTINNYAKLWTDSMFGTWFANTLIVSILTCLIATFYIIAVAYVVSRLRFKMRKPLLNIALILGMFPAFMSMIAVYYLLKAIDLTQSLAALVIFYPLGLIVTHFYIAKGFFDTIPKSLDEAAKIDGATNAQVFTKVIIPMSKPIIVYTTLITFIAPWVDFIFARVIMGDDIKHYTVAVGLYRMLSRNQIETEFTQFAAGCVCIAIPIAILFMFMQRYYVEGITGGAVKG